MRLLKLFSVLVLLGMAGVTTHAQAQSAPASTFDPSRVYTLQADQNATPFTNTTPASATCASYPGLANHIAGCIRVTLNSATTAFFSPSTGVYSILSQAITYGLVLAVTIYGCMAALGMIEKVGRDTIMLVLKIAMVSFFATNAGGMYNTMLSAMDATAQTVVAYVPTTGNGDNSNPPKTFDQMNCLKKMSQNSTTGTIGTAGPWLAIDCMIDTVIGIKIDASSTTSLISAGTSAADPYNNVLSGNDSGLSRGMLYFFFSSWHTSILGVILALVGSIFVWGLLNMLAKSLFIYIAGYLGVAVLMILSPMFIPLVLFQVTRGYFDAWVKLLVGFALQPVFMLVFIVMSVAAVDLALFTGDYSMMYRLAGDASRQPGFSLNTYLTKSYLKVDSSGNPVLDATGKQATESGIQTTAKTVMYVKSDSATPNGTAATTTLNSVVQKDIGNLKASACTNTLKAADPSTLTADQVKLQQLCKQAYPVAINADTVNWNLLARIRQPVVNPVNDDGTAMTYTTPDQHAAQMAQQIEREVFSGALFAAMVVFVMNAFLKVVPTILNDLLGDFAQTPNLAKLTKKFGKR